MRSYFIIYSKLIYTLIIYLVFKLLRSITDHRTKCPPISEPEVIRIIYIKDSPTYVGIRFCIQALPA